MTFESTEHTEIKIEKKSCRGLTASADIPDVIALPVNHACEVLAAAGYTATTKIAESGYRQEEGTGSMYVGYVVAQKYLGDDEVCLKLVLKNRRED